MKLTTLKTFIGASAIAISGYATSAGAAPFYWDQHGGFKDGSEIAAGSVAFSDPLDPGSTDPKTPDDTYGTITWVPLTPVEDSILEITTYDDATAASDPTPAIDALISSLTGTIDVGDTRVISTLKQTNNVIEGAYTYIIDIVASLALYTDAGRTTVADAGVFPDVNTNTIEFFETRNNGNNGFFDAVNDAGCTGEGGTPGPAGGFCDDRYEVINGGFASLGFVNAGQNYKLDFGIIPGTGVVFDQGFFWTEEAESPDNESFLHITMSLREVPEPAILGLMGIGLIGIGFAGIRRRKS